MTSQRIGVLLGMLLLGLPSGAYADWMIGAFLGHPWTMASDVTLTLPGQQTDLEIVGVHYRGESFKAPLYYGVRLSWVSPAHPWLGVEGEFIHAKVYSEADRTVQLRGTLRGVPIDAAVPLGTIVQRLSMSHGFNFLLANVALRRGVGPVDAQGARRVVAVIRAGAGPMLPNAESTINFVSESHYESGGIGAQASGGLEVAVWRDLGVQGEYKFTWARPVLGVAGGEATIPARSHHLVMGFTYGF